MHLKLSRRSTFIRKSRWSLGPYQSITAGGGGRCLGLCPRRYNPCFRGCPHPHPHPHSVCCPLARCPRAYPELFPSDKRCPHPSLQNRSSVGVRLWLVLSRGSRTERIFLGKPGVWVLHVSYPGKRTPQQGAPFLQTWTHRSSRECALHCPESLTAGMAQREPSFLIQVAAARTISTPPCLLGRVLSDVNSQDTPELLRTTGARDGTPPQQTPV